MEPINQFNKKPSEKTEKILFGVIVMLILIIVSSMFYLFTLNQQLVQLKNRIVKNLTNQIEAPSPLPSLPVVGPSPTLSFSSPLEKEVVDVQIDNIDEDLKPLQTDLDQL